MRGVMIGIGAKLIAEFHWILYVFGVLLIATAVKMLVLKDSHSSPERNLLVRLTKRLVPVTERFHGERFFVRAGSEASREAEVPGDERVCDPAVARTRVGSLMITPLMLALVTVESTDLIFAVDSIPAIFAVTTDPFIVYTSNVFAILGLRSLYFALAGVMDKFHYLKIGLGVVLAFVGVKMLLAHSPYKLDTLLSLGVVVGILAMSVVASLLRPKTTGSFEGPGGPASLGA